MNIDNGAEYGLEILKKELKYEKIKNKKIVIFGFNNGAKLCIYYLHSLSIAPIAIVDNDKKIREDMELREKESIVECYNLNELDGIVKNGKIAKVHLKNTDKNVHIVESYLTGGEVLGFGLKKEYGHDIVTQEDVDTIAFVSRRS